MAFTFASNPFTLNYIVPTPGTPVPILAGVSGAVNSGVTARSIYCETGQRPGTENTGNVYLGAKGFVKSTGVGVIKTFKPGETFTVQSDLKSITLDSLWLDSDTAGDGLIINGIVADGGAL